MLLDSLMLSLKDANKLLWLKLVGYEVLTLAHDFDFFYGADSGKGALNSCAVEKEILQDLEVGGCTSDARCVTLKQTFATFYWRVCQLERV